MDNLDEMFRDLEMELTPYFSDAMAGEAWGKTHSGADAGATIRADVLSRRRKEKSTRRNVRPAAPAVAASAAVEAVEAEEVAGSAEAADVSVMFSMHSDGSASMTLPGASVFLRQRQASVVSGSEYEIGGVIGMGGMGMVNAARQASLDRRVVVKTIRAEYAALPDAQEKFITEALATGSLDHPNVVPIHDMGIGADGKPFYVMKEVRGATWKELLPKMTEQENIDVLLRVCDAIACAHDKGIIHRDIKPENVMLGDYGEALVMDWGIAAALSADAKAAPLGPANACAGTPAYMAPEMARGQAGELGPWSDQYLLGGALYQILTGLPPHPGKSAKEGIRNAANNVIAKSDRDDEWVRVARRAMDTLPERRFKSVKEFQKALADCRVHSNSIELARQGSELLETAANTADYDDFARAVYALEQAGALWLENPGAGEKLRAAHLAYAECAFGKGDYDLALSQLKGLDGPDAAALAEKAEQEKREATARRHRIGMLRRVAVLLGLLILVILAASSIMISRQAQAERLAREDAEEQRAIADEQRAKAEVALAAEAEARQAEATANAMRLRDQEGKLAAEAEARQRAEEALRAREEIQRLGYLEDNSRWRFDAAEAVRRQEADAEKHALPLRLAAELPGRTLAMNLIPSGVYVMGSPPRDPSRNSDEYLHEVELPGPFYLGATEVTRADWQAVMGVETLAGIGLSPGDDGAENVLWRLRPVGEEDAGLPASGVSHREVTEIFLPRLNDMRTANGDGGTYRLPTEAEWEWAARAGSTGHFYSGDGAEELSAAAWYDGNSFGRAHRVGEKAANAWGLYDMIGNVWEMIADSYDALYYLRSERTNPVNLDASIQVKVNRGGSYINSSRLCRMSYRGAYMHRENRYPHAGFRLAYEPPPAVESE